MDIYFLFLILGTGTSFLLLYARKKKWASAKNRWLITAVLLLIGLLGYLFNGLNATSQGFQFLYIPVAYNCFDRLFKNLSFRISGRDFYLYLRHSGEIDDGMFASNTHVNGFDKLFSILLLVIIMGLLLCAVLAERAYKLGHI